MTCLGVACGAEEPNLDFPPLGLAQNEQDKCCGGPLGGGISANAIATAVGRKSFRLIAGFSWRSSPRFTY